MDQFLFVYGDKPAVGSRTSELTVRAMVEEVRALDTNPIFADRAGFRVGVAAGPGPIPAWKRAADFACLQVNFSVDETLRWRAANSFDGPVYAGVMVLASEQHARQLAATIPDIAIPERLVEAVRKDPAAGVEMACEQVLGLREAGACAGVHLIPVSRYRQVAARLEAAL